MLDIRQIRREPDAFRRRLERRGGDVQLEPVLELHARRRELIGRAEQLAHEKNEAEKGIRTADKSSPEFAAFRERMRSVGTEIKAAKEALTEVEAELDQRLLVVPNVPDEDIPDGTSEADNRVMRTWGDAPTFEFEPKPHWELGEGMGLLDLERGAKVAKARFPVLKGALARLERALMAFMLDLHTEAHGYVEVMAPYLVNSDSMQGTGQFPKFVDDAFRVESDDLVLVPTAEVPLTNLHRDEIFDEGALPVRYTGFTPCFRREAGGYGRDTRGLIRLHQFQKVELVQFVEPEKSQAALEELTGHAETVLQQLGLHHRVVDLCTGDLGFAAARTYDIEVWLPGQGEFREISSCSNCRDYQARRARIRHRVPGEKKPQLVHTLNGSGLAIGRTVVAILENYQRSDGTVVVPEALRPYMGGLTRIGAGS